MMRAPLAPIGWPSAQAPPLTLTISCATFSSAISAIGTTAKASLTSHRSTSLTLQPALASTFCVAPTGAVVNQFGLLRVHGMGHDTRQRLAAQAWPPWRHAS